MKTHSHHTFPNCSQCTSHECRYSHLSQWHAGQYANDKKLTPSIEGWAKNQLQRYE